jgi:hypothetical protein
MIDIITGIDPRLKPTNGIDAGLSAVGKLRNWKINKLITQLIIIVKIWQNVRIKIHHVIHSPTFFLFMEKVNYTRINFELFGKN